VEAFLPSDGQQAVLPNGQMTDPSNYNSTLASHLVSLFVMNANGQVVESFMGIQVLKDGIYQWRIPKGNLSKGGYYFSLRLNEYQFSDRELKLN